MRVCFCLPPPPPPCTFLVCLKSDGPLKRVELRLGVLTKEAARECEASVLTKQPPRLTEFNIWVNERPDTFTVRACLRACLLAPTCFFFFSNRRCAVLAAASAPFPLPGEPHSDGGAGGPVLAPRKALRRPVRLPLLPF